MLQKILLATVAVSAFGTTLAQDSATTSALTINGSADVYYRYDFGKTRTNNLTSFTNSHNRFELGMASVKFDYKTSKVELVADLGFGKRAQEFSYNDAGTLAAIKQLYVSYSASEWLKLTAGSWATHVGYELVDAYANRNYSMSYMFTNGPFFHTGAKADLTVGRSGFMIGVANPTDYKYVPDGVMNKKFVLAQYSFAASNLLKVYVNYVGGQNIDTSRTKQVDLVVTGKVSNHFNLAFDGTVTETNRYLGKEQFAGYKNWWGAALYANYDATDNFGLTLRGEYFSDSHGLKYAALEGDGSIFATTISAKLKAANLTVIPELRIDAANKEIFLKTDGSPTKTAASALIAAVFSF